MQNHPDKPFLRKIMKIDDKTNEEKNEKKDEKRNKIKCINIKRKYEDLFNSKQYIPHLKASKEDLECFFKLVLNHLETQQTENIYIEIMNFLCANFTPYIGIFGVLWNECKVLLCEKLILIEFFKQLKINIEILNHFFNCGYDSVETFLTITPMNLIEIQKTNNVFWLPGHAFRLKMIFSKIKDYMDIFFEKNADYIKNMKKVILKHRRKIKLTDRLVLRKDYNDIHHSPFQFTTIQNPIQNPNTRMNITDINLKPVIYPKKFIKPPHPGIYNLKYSPSPVFKSFHYNR